MSRIRDTSSRPLQRQQSQISSDAGSRVIERREKAGFLCKMAP
jgi:hypothetical protein